MTAGHIYLLATTGLTWQSGLLLGASGNIVVADSATVGVIAARSGTFYGIPMTAGNLYSIAGTGTPGFSGDGGTATLAQLSEAEGIAIDAHGNVLVADATNAMVRIITVQSGQFYGIYMNAGHIYDLAANEICGTAGNGALATMAATYPSRSRSTTPQRPHHRIRSAPGPGRQVRHLLRRSDDRGPPLRRRRQPNLRARR